MSIKLKGADEHNLKGIDVEFGDGLTVVTGVSGSGKTSLVFDTLYHEARRRFLEVFTLGSVAKRLSPARVESITGIGPAVAVGQNLLNRNPYSTLATASGLHPFLRLLYARFGERICAQCGSSLTILNDDDIVNHLAAIAARSVDEPVKVFAPLVRDVQGSHQTLLELLVRAFDVEKVVVDGCSLAEMGAGPHSLDAGVRHDIEVEIAHLENTLTAIQTREIVQAGEALGAHSITIRGEDASTTLSRAPVCTVCGARFGDIEPVHFNTRCSHCQGAGCEKCQRSGLHPEAAAIRLQDFRFIELLALPVEQASHLFTNAALPASAERLVVEITRRLEALNTVGLGYITLDRPSPTLSRGEAQRVRLAVALTSRLEDMLHVLDEPTIGQHPADVTRLLPAFRQLSGPVVYVEHDRVAAAVADQAIDLGPGAGVEGGSLVFSGTPEELWRTDSPTGRFFSGRQQGSLPEPRPKVDQFFTVRGAYLRNLKHIDVPIPLQRLTVISGVSGSGKSTLVEDVLVASLSKGSAVGCLAIEDQRLKPVLVDQNPIGRNPRSNPATYTKLADPIRDYFSTQIGLSPSHFSFNRPEGACPSCKGMGAIEVQMRYLPSTWIPCSTCGGRRFSDEILAARARFGERWLSIADVYQLSVAELYPLLTESEAISSSAWQRAKRILEAMVDVGLGYLPLGQPSPTLSGGEAQRVKLAKHLGGRSLSKSLLVLDEPSTGLHPQDIAGLLVVLDRLVRAGATIVVVEHNTDIIRAADWVVDLGPGAGPHGGEVLFTGPPDGLPAEKRSLTGRALVGEADLKPPAGTPAAEVTSAPAIQIRKAQVHNLKGVDVDILKGALTVVTGVSGSGKSSLVLDVLAAEARRRFLETLSLYERQSTREGSEADVESIGGLGVAITVGSERRLYDRRATVGTATEIAHHLGVLLAWIGGRTCLECGGEMRRGRVERGGAEWRCPNCQAWAAVAEPRHFSPANYAASCLECNGVGSLQAPNPDKLIIHPDKPLCAGAMHSPGFFPKGYLCKPFNHGFNFLQALAERYDFDPATTPWEQMSSRAQKAFLFGDPEPMEVTFQSRTRTSRRWETFPGFYGWVRDWDVGGTYTDTEPCPSCCGARLRPEYLAVTLLGYNLHALSEMPLSGLSGIIEDISQEVEKNGTSTVPGFLGTSLDKTIKRLHFLERVGLGYLNLNRLTSTLSAGEAQRVKLAGLLGGGLTALTVTFDEPTRGLHPAEVEALVGALRDLRDEGNTVVVVEHDLTLIRAADQVIDLGPGAGIAGGEIIAQGTPAQVAREDTPTGFWLRGGRGLKFTPQRRQPSGWWTIKGARENNLRGEQVRLPLGVMVGVCGLSGSGKSTLMIDTLGRALAPKKHTTSVAYEPLDPGVYEAIEGAPGRTVLIDQGKAGLVSPASFLRIDGPLRKLYAASEEAMALGLSVKDLSRGCAACKGRGRSKTDMGFLPAVYTPCETCRGSGYKPEAWEIRLKGVSLPDLGELTIDQVYELFGEEKSLAGQLACTKEVGLGYLVTRQPGYTLSGGEAQRLKMAKELCRKTTADTLYILDEPTVGLHLEDVTRLTGVLDKLVDQGHTVVVVEHHPHLLAACDWLVELGPGGGPDGGSVIAAGTPGDLAGGGTPIASYLGEVLGAP